MLRRGLRAHAHGPLPSRSGFSLPRHKLPLGSSSQLLSIKRGYTKSYDATRPLDISAGHVSSLTGRPRGGTSSKYASYRQVCWPLGAQVTHYSEDAFKVTGGLWGSRVCMHLISPQSGRRGLRAASSGSGGDGDDGKGPKDPKEKEEKEKEGEDYGEKNKVYILEPHEQMSVYLRHLSVTPTPRTVPVLPLNLNPSFAGTTHYVLIDKKLLNTLRELWLERKFLGLFLTKDVGNIGKRDSMGSTTEMPHVYEVGQLGCILGLTQYSASGVFLAQICSVSRRIRLKSPMRPDAERNGLYTAEIEELIEEYDKNDPVIRANHGLIAVALQQLLEQDANPYYQRLLEEIDTDPADFADLAAAGISSEPEMQQAVLETLDVKARQRIALELLQKKIDIFRRQKEITANSDTEKVQREEQRRYYLEKQKKTIEKELGVEGEESDKLLEEFRSRLEGKNIPQDAMTVINEEMNKLSTLERSSSEYNVTRTYLNWLTVLPWGVFAPESLSVKKAFGVLEEDHYGLRDIKERILEFIAVGNLKGSVQGKILCFVGPPGVGKTSIGKSIARSLDREFFRFSVGGLSDVSEIKGHRRTYVGAMPGKLLQCLKTLKSSNPVILIDEIDKMGRSHQGDPASALLEVLDPEQNKTFLDHYLDVPYDLSKVLFVCTANVTDTIPGPLLDRMEVIRLSGYVAEEKLNIARKYLIPAISKDSGLTSDHAELTEEAVAALITNYCREAGVRELYKHIEKIHRKIAFKVAKSHARVPPPETSAANTDTPVASTETTAPATVTATADTISSPESATSTPTNTSSAPAAPKETPAAKPVYTGPKHTVTASNLSEYVGQPKFASDRFYEETPPGVVMGLAWTALGGATLYIETVSDRVFLPYESGTPETDIGVESDSETNVEKGTTVGKSGGINGRGRLQTTGQMGAVMQESTAIAYTYAKNFLEELSPLNAFFDRAALHMHIPEGATPKDGPSAGCTMVTSLLSLALQRPVPNDIAMTGELTLTGKILSIGGVKEKTIAARRSRVKRLFFPEGNRKDWEELPDYIKEGLEPRFVREYRDIFSGIFPDIPLGVGTKDGGSTPAVDEKAEISGRPSPDDDTKSRIQSPGATPSNDERQPVTASAGKKAAAAAAAASKRLSEDKRKKGASTAPRVTSKGKASGHKDTKTFG